MSSSSSAPAAASAPSVFTVMPIAAPFTIGWSGKAAVYSPGRMISSNIAKITTSIDTVTGITGFALIAPPVAIAAETPQIEIPDASTAETSRCNLNERRASVYTIGQKNR